MKIIILTILFTLGLCYGIIGQAGIYSESDIELQNIFIEAQLEKQKGNTEKQIELLREVARRDRSSDAAYFELAKVYMSTENAELAESSIKKAIRLKPNNEWYLKLQVEIYKTRKKYKDAVQVASALVRKYPEKIEYHYLLTDCQISAGDSDGAIQTLLELQSKKGITEEVSKRVFEIYNSEKNIKSAIATLRELSAAYPGNIRFLTNLAGYLYENDEKDQALSYYKRVLDLDPDNSEANLTLARESAEGDKDYKRLDSVEKMIANENIPLDDKIKELMPFMSNMKREGPQTEKLNELSQMLLEKYPDEAKTHAVRADILFYSGKLIDSELMYQKAIELDDSKYALWDQWLVNLWELGNYKKMRTKAELAVDLFPNKFYAWLYYSLALEMTSEIHKAAENLSEASLIAGNNKAFLDALSIAENWLEMRRDASSLIIELSQIDENNIISPVLYDMLGDIYQSGGKLEKSRKYWNQALNYGAGQERIKNKLGTLN